MLILGHCSVKRSIMAAWEHERDIVYSQTLYMHVGLMDLEMCVAKIAEHN